MLNLHVVLVCKDQIGSISSLQMYIHVLVYRTRGWKLVYPTLEGHEALLGSVQQLTVTKTPFSKALRLLVN